MNQTSHQNQLHMYTQQYLKQVLKKVKYKKSFSIHHLTDNKKKGLSH